MAAVERGSARRTLTSTLTHVARMLEILPALLPGAKHAPGPLLPVGEFSVHDVAVYAVWLCGWYGFGLVSVAARNPLAALAYALLGPLAYVCYVYLACTKCPYYGKRCYMGGGLCAHVLFAPRAGDYTLADDLLVPLLWLTVSLYPAVFLAFAGDWLSLAAYAALALGWQIFHKRRICSKCLNVRCALNPHFVGRTRATGRAINHSERRSADGTFSVSGGDASRHD